MLLTLQVKLLLLVFHCCESKIFIIILEQWFRFEYIICWYNCPDSGFWYIYCIYLKSSSKPHPDLYPSLLITFLSCKFAKLQYYCNFFQQAWCVYAYILYFANLVLANSQAYYQSRCLQIVFLSSDFYYLAEMWDYLKP